MTSIVLGGLALAAMPAVAMAADLPPPPVYYTPPPPVVVPTNWYFRLDVGVKDYRPPSITFNAPNLGYEVPGNGVMIDTDISTTGVVGFGIGRDFGSFRADITLDYEWPGEIEGRLYCVACDNDPVDEYSWEWADLSVWSLLFNGYIDFGRGDGPITPYVGAGIGVATLRTSNVHFENPDGATGEWEGMRTWNFAWALMAGTQFKVTDRLSLDVNYRFVHLGTAMAMTPLDGGTPIVYGPIRAHEFRLGFRVGIGGQ
ncbi:MAG: porin family protein [Bauldia sp.]|nr:porin family protein [Bauldia sp.]